MSLLLKVLITLSLSILVAQCDPNDIDFTGHFEMVLSTNFDAFLEALGINEQKRAKVANSTSEYFITKNSSSGEYTLRKKTSYNDKSVTFVDRVEFRENRFDGLVVPTVIRIQGNKWNQTQFGEPEVSIVREFNLNGVKVLSKIGNITAVRMYDRQW